MKLTLERTGPKVFFRKVVAFKKEIIQQLHNLNMLA